MPSRPAAESLRPRVVSLCFLPKTDPAFLEILPKNFDNYVNKKLIVDILRHKYYNTVTKQSYVNRKGLYAVKVFGFKFLVTALFLLIALFAAGFSAQASPNANAQSEVASVQQTAEADTLGSGFVLTFDAEGCIPA